MMFRQHQFFDRYLVAMFLIICGYLRLILSRGQLAVVAGARERRRLAAFGVVGDELSINFT